MTFLPYNTTPPASPRIWAIGRIASKEHFVQVNLHEGSPLPPVYALWRSHRSEEAREWEGVVADRIRLFGPFLPESHTTGDTIELD
ncbi:hypothetical protein RIF29_30086 [Crotalaria pallida]|uniref:Uncharacterized protein n=1 Tax=Crotalaria pallida TaxID=3830 RepID=A0AAN9EFY7_CROPI